MSPAAVLATAFLCPVLFLAPAYNQAQVLSTHQEMQDLTDFQETEGLQIMSTTTDSYDVLLVNKSATESEEDLESMNMTINVVVEDVNEKETAKKKAAIANNTCEKGSCFGWEKYYRLDDIYNYLDYLQDEYPDLISIETIGLTAEEQPLKLVKILTQSNESHPRAIWLDGCVHAREWISAPATLYILSEVARSLDSNETTFQGLDYYILPVMNPDGYEYSHTTDRFWRKNRSKNNSSECVGTDLNRNWGHSWGGKGSTDNPCSINYRGSHAFSELETAAVSSYMLNISSKIKAYLSLHSYGQVILFPFADTYTQPSDYKDLYELAEKMSSSIKKRNNIHYTYGTVPEFYSIAPGGAQDWAKKKANIKYSYTMELRDRGKFGFSLPPAMILETAKDALAAFTVLANNAKSE